MELLRRTQCTLRAQKALADHVHEFNSGKSCRGGPKGFEPHHRPHHSFDGSVVLFDDVGVEWSTSTLRSSIISSSCR